MGLKRWLVARVTAWLTHEQQQARLELPLCDFVRLSDEIRPGDVLLVEGDSRVSTIIKTLTQSPWSHAALCIGRLEEIEDPLLRERVRSYCGSNITEPLLIEPLLGEGTVVSSLAKYSDCHLRICRPGGLSDQDRQLVLATALVHLGGEYDFRHMVDLARFMVPVAILPRRWRSTLFNYRPGEHSKTLCSTMIAEAFAAVHYPVRPVVQSEPDGRLKMYRRNPRLYTPSDFDYSPYFEIIKYPLLGGDDLTLYRQLPWDQQGVVCNTRGDCYTPVANTSTESRNGVVADGAPLPRNIQHKV